MSRQKNDPVRELGVMYEPPTVSLYLIRLFLLITLLAAVHLLVQAFRLTFSWYAIPESLIIALGVAGYFLKREATPAESAPVPARQRFLSVNWPWLLLAAILGTVIVIFTIQPALKPSAAQWVKTNPFVVLVLAGAVIGLGWFAGKTWIRDRSAAAGAPPPATTPAAKIRKIHKRVLVNLAALGFVALLFYLVGLPHMSWTVQKWWNATFPMTVFVPLCFLVSITALSFMLIPQYLLVARWLKRIAWISFGVGALVDLLLFWVGIAETQPATAAVLGELWSILWKPIFIPSGWLVLVGVPLWFLLAQSFPLHPEYNEPSQTTLLPFMGITGMEIWVFFHQHLP